MRLLDADYRLLGAATDYFSRLTKIIPNFKSHSQSKA